MLDFAKGFLLNKYGRYFIFGYSALLHMFVYFALVSRLHL